MTLHRRLGLTVLSAVVLAGCGTGGSQSTGTTAEGHAPTGGAVSVAGTAATSPGGTAPAATPPTSTAPAGSTPPGPGTTEAVSAGPGPCATSELKVSLGQAQGTAGSTYQPIDFTDTASVGCSLAGFPGVSYVAPGSGAQVGEAAGRAPGHPATVVDLAPGVAVEAVLQEVDPGDFPPSECAQAPVAGYRVYPPGQTESAFVAAAGMACSATSMSQPTLFVGPIETAGAAG